MIYGIFVALFFEIVKPFNEFFSLSVVEVKYYYFILHNYGLSTLAASYHFLAKEAFLIFDRKYGGDFSFSRVVQCAAFFVF